MSNERAEWRRWHEKEVKLVTGIQSCRKDGPGRGDSTSEERPGSVLRKSMLG